MSDEREAAVEFYPPWRQALVAFLEAQFPHEAIVPHEWFYEHFGLEMPNDHTPLAVAQRVELQRLAQFTQLKSVLLINHQIKLVSEPGAGYRIVHPRDQVKRAYSEGVKEMKKTLRQMIDDATHVNQALLTSEERREQADGLARIGMLRGMFRQVRALPSTDEE